MHDAKPVDNPTTLTKETVETEGDEPLSATVPYREAVGSLMYAANITRPDITFAVNRISRAVASPVNRDWTNVKRILRYLVGKTDICLKFSNKGEKGTIIAYCDADFAGDSTGKSTTGYVILYHGTPIQWKTQKQPLVTLSSTEAELVSICTVVKDVIWVRMLATELGIIDNSPTRIYCDNQSAIKLAHDEGSVQRTRHMGVRAAFVREQIQGGEIEIEHVAGDKQAADFLTKPLTTSKFTWNRNFLMSTLKLLMLICLMCKSTNGMVFEATKPIIWIPTNNFVDAGVTEYKIHWTIISPCEALRAAYMKANTNTIGGRVKRQIQGNPLPPPILNQNQGQVQMQQQKPMHHMQIQPLQTHVQVSGPHQENFSADFQSGVDENAMNEYILRECNDMWEGLFMTKLNELRNRVPRIKGNHHIKTRSLGDIVETTAEVICAGCVSNIISTVLSRIYPGSDHNRINRLEDHTKEFEHKVDEFNQSFNITHEIIAGMMDMMQEFRLHEHETRHQIAHLAYLLPKISWTSAYMQSRITSSAADLKTVIDEYSFGRVACKEMAVFLGLKELEEVDNLDTQFGIIRKSGPRSVILEFAIRNRAKYTQVYKVSSFRFWDNLTNIPTLMEYRGYNHLIYNETSNCLKAIEEPETRAVLEECTEYNYTDPRLNIWEKLVETRDVQRFNHTCQVKRTMEYHYIYCFPFNITTKMGTFRNPPHVFRLPISEPFRLPIMNFNYVPIIRRLNITGPSELPAIDSIHLGHFPMGSEATDEVKWFEKMQALMKENELLVSEKDRSIRVEKQSGLFWFLLTMTVILVLTTAGLITYNILLSQESTDRHRSMHNDIMELKSNYCEIKECAKCTQQAVQSNVATKGQKTEFTVGNDSSVTINLNRHLPEIPLPTIPIITKDTRSV